MKKTMMVGAVCVLALGMTAGMLSCSTPGRGSENGPGGFGGPGGSGGMQGGPGGPPGQGQGGTGGDMSMGGGPGSGPGGGQPPQGGMASSSQEARGAALLGSAYALSIEGGGSRGALALRDLAVVMGGSGTSLGPVEVNLVLENRSAGELRVDWAASSFEEEGRSERLFVLSQKYAGADAAAAPITIPSAEAIAESVLPLTRMAVSASTGLPEPTPMSSGTIQLRIAYNDTQGFTGADSFLVVLLTPLTRG